MSPCPLTKEQVNIQPRRVYYYLTTCARQPIPELVNPSSLNSVVRIISPSISSGPDDEEQRDTNLEARRKERDAPSPSPEPDLIAAVYNHEPENMSGVAFAESSEYPSASIYDEAYQQAASPPLESDEREFTHTASVMATRRAVEQSATPDIDPGPPSMDATHQHLSGNYLSMANEGTMDHNMDDRKDETEEMEHLKNHEVASALFGGQYNHLGVGSSNEVTLNSSPMIRPTLSTKDMPPPVFARSFRSAAEDDAAWHELRSPDCVGLSELDDLLGGV